MRFILFVNQLIFMFVPFKRIVFTYCHSTPGMSHFNNTGLIVCFQVQFKKCISIYLLVKSKTLFNLIFFSHTNFIFCKITNKSNSSLILMKSKYFWSSNYSITHSLIDSTFKWRWIYQQTASLPSPSEWRNK